MLAVTGHPPSPSTALSISVSFMHHQNTTLSAGAGVMQVINDPRPPTLHDISLGMSMSMSAPGLSVPMQMEACKRGWVAPFLLHLHQMLRRESHHIIRWTADGKAFEILDKKTMTEKILPKYFRNKNFASFQRQLNYFGFRKWSKSRAMYSTYSREHFTRDNFDELVFVKRQSKKKCSKDDGGSEEKSDVDMDDASSSTDASAVGSSPAKTLPSSAESSPLCVSQVAIPPMDMTFPAQTLVEMQHMTPSASAPQHSLMTPVPLSFNAHFSLPALSEMRQISPHGGMRLPSIHQIVPSMLSPCPWPVDGSKSDESVHSPRVATSASGPKIDYNVKELVGLSAARFIRGLYDMISSDEGDCIRWSDDGASFVVVNSSKLAWEALPKYFKHNKFRSFQQQLNMYGFQKWSKARAPACTYSHPLFRRGQFTDLCRIARKTSMP
ncbi:Aste57867_14709 [Aphanomyces stellatus]|uniref:Aste57867_14709 protein n=1 Tax=Aphanomyces stellatus TaxID=120398 RepID=A0A485L269_9STRA|nr:hypothetical protein As57867_014654 [Aphanomyces stellatus]VFT91527.1 Aste57867_14709 [Aphanomyces stellatus]